MSNYVDVWNELHKEYVYKNKVKYDDWLDKFSDIINSTNGEIIDLGCGVTGNNTIYLLEKGKNVISCDFAIEALKVIKKIKGSKTLLFDMLDRFPFCDDKFEMVIADLSLHYFKNNDTFKIISEIKRILKPNGYLFFRLNSTNTKEYKQLIENNIVEIEKHLFYTKNMEKRFFNEEDINYYFKDFKKIYLKEDNMNRYNSEKIVWVGVYTNIK